MKEDTIALLKNKNFLLLGFTYAVMYGVYGCLGGILNTLVTPYDFTSTHSAIFGAVFIVFGLAGSFYFSIYLDKHPKYLKCLRILCFGTFLSGAFLIINF